MSSCKVVYTIMDDGVIKVDYELKPRNDLSEIPGWNDNHIMENETDNNKS